MPLLIYSRSPEVDFKWIQFSLDTLNDFIFTLSFVLSTWMTLCAKGKLAPTVKEFILFDLHMVFYSVLSYVKSIELVSGWWFVLIHFLANSLLYVVGKKMFQTKSDVLRA